MGSWMGCGNSIHFTSVKRKCKRSLNINTFLNCLLNIWNGTVSLLSWQRFSFHVYQKGVLPPREMKICNRESKAERDRCLNRPLFLSNSLHVSYENSIVTPKGLNPHCVRCFTWILTAALRFLGFKMWNENIKLKYQHTLGAVFWRRVWKGKGDWELGEAELWVLVSLQRVRVAIAFHLHFGERGLRKPLKSNMSLGEWGGDTSLRDLRAKFVPCIQGGRDGEPKHTPTNGGDQECLSSLMDQIRATWR